MQKQENIDITLYILKYLYENTDIDHKVTRNDIFCYLKELGVKINEDQLSRALLQLIKKYTEVLQDENTYYVYEKKYSIGDIQLLIDITQPEWFLAYMNYVQKIKEIKEEHGTLLQ